METGSGQVVVSLETPPSTLVGTESRVTDGPIQTGALTQRTPSCLGSASTALWTAGQSKGAKVSSNTGEAPASGGTPQNVGQRGAWKSRDESCAKSDVDEEIQRNIGQISVAKSDVTR